MSESLTETLFVNGHQFDINEVHEGFIRFHNRVTISMDGFEILNLTDVCAKFDTNKIDFVHYDSQLGTGFLDLIMLTKICGKGKVNGKQ